MFKSSFLSRITCICDRSIIRLPSDVSQALPSRGQCMAYITIKDNKSIVSLEPDGMKGHWFFVDINEGNQVMIDLEVTDDWFAPELPDDISNKIQTDTLNQYWNQLTIKAQWEWLRWIRSAIKQSTREHRINTMISMLLEGKKRPCCFNQTLCSVTEVSKNGKLVIY